MKKMVEMQKLAMTSQKYQVLVCYDQSTEEVK